MTDPTYLDRILDHKREEVARQKLKVPTDQIKARIADAPPIRSLSLALRRSDRIALIAEVKQRSPSKGVLVPNFDAVEIARTYLDHGADALSILTDVRFFGGSLQYLKAIRQLQAEREVALCPDDPTPASNAQPLLRKDFILDPYQVYEARAYGADALLLIVAALPDQTLRELLDLAEGLGMDALIEVHDEAELDRALAVGASIVGVNDRDLRTFEVDLATTERLAARLQSCDRPILVAESGIHTAAHVGRLRAVRADAILVGEAIVTAPDMAVKIRELIGEPGTA